MPIVELYGVLRVIGKVPQIQVAAATIGACLSEVERQIPTLKGRVLHEGELSPAYRISIDGKRFVDDLTEAVESSAHILVIAADLGG